MTAALALEPRRASLVAASFARDPDDLRLLLDALGLLPEPGAPQGFPRPRVVPAHTRHTRGKYVPGCRNCRAVNAAFMARWRARRKYAETTIRRERPAKPEQLCLPFVP